jgi:hypothetical protein
VTLFSTTSRSESPASSPPRKQKRVPAPLVLAKDDKEIEIELAPRSAMIKPPMSPNRDLLRGMEMCAKDVGVNARGSMNMMVMHSPGAVGVAF